MRKVVLALVATGPFFLAGSAWTQISMVHVTSCSVGVFPGTVCIIPSTGIGNLIVVGWQMGAGADTTTTISGVADNIGNIYTEAGSARSIDTNSGSMVDVWYSKNSTPGATSITITPSATVTSGAVVIWEFSGIDTAVPLDATSTLNSQPSTTTPSGAAVIISSPAEVIVSLAIVANSVTGIFSGNGFTNDSQLNAQGWAHLITSSPGAFFAQWNQSSAGTYASSTVSFKAAASGITLNACDLNQDGAVNAVDSQLAVNMALGLLPCTANIAGFGVCNTDVANRVITAALCGNCVTNGSATLHSVTLTWLPSISINIIAYNVYRATTSGGPYTRVGLSPVPVMIFTDSNVQAGQTYYYVVTAVDFNNNESVYSNEAPAIVPTP
jgi:hypothetical protein